MKIYRCGFCGQPCDEHGIVLHEYNILDYENLENDICRVHGECCVYEQNGQPDRMRVTRDMAIDAGDMSLEGEWI